MEHKANMLWIPPDSTYNINQAMMKMMIVPKVNIMMMNY